MGSELTTASLRLAPQKLLPFGGSPHLRADAVIQSQDDWVGKIFWLI